MTDEQIQSLKEPGGKKQDLWTPEERAVIDFTDRLTSYPASITAQDLEQLGRFLNEKQIVELVLTIGTANLTNRFNEGVMTPVDV